MWLISTCDLFLFLIISITKNEGNIKVFYRINSRVEEASSSCFSEMWLKIHVLEPEKPLSEITSEGRSLKSRRIDKLWVAMEGTGRLAGRKC